MLNTSNELNGQVLKTYNGYRNGHTNGFANGHSNGHSAEKSGHAAIEAAVQTILANVGEDPDRQGLVGTPNRVARMYDEILAGYHVDPVKLVNGALFDVEYDEMIVVKEIEYFSMCEHHMLPFFGRVHVAYIPSDKVIGLSKIPRIVEMYARRLQVQERMTRQIADMIDEILQPRGVAVVVEGSHMCSMMRGVKKEHPRMVTTALLGEFKENETLRKEFMSQLHL
ncbi:MAG: GTP cyclohydrolase I FolE [Ardenticatenaceae bacterium]|nr:GTP cyclohydrolase I FolE [Anaerolineales bacterium]MCB8919720.1 GTP cyclohydrolase I FolE [Ardenticatenaceae bacterium]